MMHAPRSSLALVLVIAACVGGCGSARTSAVAPTARLVRLPGSAAGKIVLTAVGAQRIGIETAPARPVPPPPGRTRLGPSAAIPTSAVVYDPSGTTYAFTRVAPLTFTEVRIGIDHIDGGSAYLVTGPRPGTPVVTVGAEELYGVQTGVLAQT
jgi:hypothetical protein